MSDETPAPPESFKPIPQEFWQNMQDHEFMMLLMHLERREAESRRAPASVAPTGE